MKQREIKFRAWDSRIKKWLFGYEYPNLGGFSMKGEVVCLGEYSIFMQSVPLEDWSKIILTQYTGLKDQNGKEIYEGDIVQTPCGHSLVEFSHGVFGLNHDFMNPEKQTMLGSWGQEHNLRSLDDGYYKNISVIGNIYQNN